MSRPGLVRTLGVAAATLLSTLLMGTAAPAAPAAPVTTAVTAAGPDRTPPTAPFLSSAVGYQCLSVIVGVRRSSDNVTPSTALRYEVTADGVVIGTMADKPTTHGVYELLHLPHPGNNTVTVRAIDLAGNRSAPSNAQVAWGFFTPGCAPGRIG